MENMPLAINLTFVGITVVFISLVLLSLIISFSTKLLSLKGKAASKDDASASGADTLEIEEDDADNTITAAAVPTSENSDDELIAVIMAAIQASMIPGSQCKLQVKSFRRIEQKSPAWNKAGRLEQISNRL